MLFDMDGTLVDSTPIVERTWTRWALKHQLNAAEVVGYAHGRPTADTIRLFMPQVDAKAEAAALLAEEELDPTPVRTINGALEAVQIVNQYATWAVVTSASRRLATLRLLGGGFPAISLLISADDIQHGKPDPEGFLRAARELGVPPDQCLVFEDTPAGLEAGLAAGAKVIGLATTFASSALPVPIVVPDLSFIALQPAGPGRLLVSLRSESRKAVQATEEPEIIS